MTYRQLGACCTLTDLRATNRTCGPSRDARLDEDGPSQLGRNFWLHAIAGLCTGKTWTLLVEALHVSRVRRKSVRSLTLDCLTTGASLGPLLHAIDLTYLVRHTRREHNACRARSVLQRSLNIDVPEPWIAICHGPRRSL